MGIKKIVYIVLGCICFGLGTIGVFLPVLPTTPLYLATAFFFAKSSDRLNNWFKGTKLYKKHLDSFVKKEGMLPSTKAGILISVTLIMGIAVFFMARKGIWIPCIIIGVVWLAHLIYFLFFVKTIHGNIDSDHDSKDASDNNHLEAE
ncbi:MAG: YbaN family protein [Lachnospiraceae bacterium]|nr:YbaN family protein [Lachnospiraceae bacterium]